MLERMEYPFSAKETYLALTLMTRHATVKCITFPRLLKYPLFVFHLLFLLCHDIKRTKIF